MGFGDPLGRFIQVGDDRKGRIIGVVKDYHFSSLREKIGPLVLIYGWGLDNIFIRINQHDVPGILSYVKGVFHELAPRDEFTYSFLDEEVARLYTDEQRLVRVLGYFCLLAILISGMGLYGLSLFTASRRTREIGVRKVNGAGIREIVFLLTRDSLRWVLWANIIAWPLGFWVTRHWLQNFAYRIDLTVWPFVLAGLGAFSISLLVILYQTLKAARANPVDSLRYE
jgi:putative ABC transport system permease protein